MNGYKMLADSYRKFLNDPTADQEDVKRHIKVLDFLATCSREDIYALFDSSAFNDIVKGYVKKLVDEAEDFTEEQKDYLTGRIGGLFDTVQAKEAERHYFN